MDTKGSKKQKRERIQKKWRVPSARWAMNGVENATNGGENALRTVLRVPSAQWLWICFRLGPRICFMNEWESESEFERAERKGVVSNFLLCVCNDRCVCVSDCMGDKWAVDIESYKLDIDVAPPGIFVQLGFAKTP